MRRRRLTAMLAVLAGALALLGALIATHGSRAHARPVRFGAASGASRAGRGASERRSHIRRAARPLASGESSQLRRLISSGRPVYCGGPRGNEVALTFDDGPGPYTRLVIHKLRKHGVGATFFIVGRNIPLVRGATRAERALGAVGDHTFGHPLLTSLSPSAAAMEIARTRKLLARSSGGSVFLFRPPYGGRDAAIDSIVRANGLLDVLWSVDSGDSLGANYAQIERNVIAGLRPGAVILMHENRGQTVRALISIFRALKRRHLRAVSVAQLLTDDPPGPAQLRAGGGGCRAAGIRLRSG